MEQYHKTDTILMRENIKDEYGILALQNKILHIAKYFDLLCQENDIDYCLMGGSALGTKRHGGFIPWDDDLDVFMTANEYDRFKTIFYLKGDKEKFYLQEIGRTNGMARLSKLRMNNTTYIEELFKDKKIHHGIFIDIFFLHVSPQEKYKQLIQFTWAKYIVLKYLSNRHYKRRKGIFSIILFIMRLFPRCFLLMTAFKQIYRYKNENTDFFCHFLGRAGFKNGRYKKDIMFPSKRILFETIELNVPANIEKYLSERFGDYMKIPSDTEKSWYQHAWKWSVDIDFRQFTSGITDDFSDEKYL